MRVVLLWLALLMALPGDVMAAQDDVRLDPLFAMLRSAPTPEAAQAAEAEIWRIWTETADPSSARLMRQGTEAMAGRVFPLALVSFNRLVARSPEFAEAWNKRATLYYLMGNYEASIADIERTLALEPRHFGALSGLGLIMLSLGRPDVALKSFEAALAVHPHLPAAKAHVDALRLQVEGSPT